MTAMVEALSFLGPVARLPVIQIRVFNFNSKHAASVCLGTMLARTHVQLVLVCQQVMQGVQHRLRLTMQHVHGHSGNLRNECVDHGAALGSLGLVSSHKLATRLIRHNFDTSACCGDCNSLSEVLENCEALELEQHRYHRVRCDSHARIASLMVLISAPFPTQPSCYSGRSMESPTSSVSSASSSGGSFEHGKIRSVFVHLYR